MWGTRDYRYNTNQAQAWVLTNGVPTQIVQYARPLNDVAKLRSAFAVYAQDRWKLKNVTVNLGVRFDYHNAYVPVQNLPSIPFVAARTYDEVTDVPSWKDVSHRLGAAWDVFANGRTVVRANYGTYLASESTATATANNPLNTSVNNATRRWTDSNNDFVPDCRLTERGENGECGALSAPLGALNIVTRFDPSIVRGWGVRPNDNEVLIGVQQQVLPRLMVDVQFTRHSFGNFFATQNLAQPPTAFDPFCVTAPLDERLPGGGGNQICGFTDVKSSSFGVTPNNLVTKASNFGKVVDVYTGVDLSFTARLNGGGLLSGGVSAGREVTDSCDVIEQAGIGASTSSAGGFVAGSQVLGYPSTLYCRVVPPYQPDVKLIGTYPLPWWGVTASATLQSRPGPQVLASYVVNQLNLSQTTLGRPVSGGQTETHLIAPGTQYGERVNQVDFRLGKNLSVGRSKIKANVDFYNLFNSSAILQWNTRYGPSWLNPTQITQGRIIKFGAQLDF
jgi:hypothetical protein